MAKQSISFLLRVYDQKLWERIVEKSVLSGDPVNTIIVNALNAYIPEIKKKVKAIK